MTHLDTAVNESVNNDSVAAKIALRFEVENFLYRESDFMDNWLLDDWFALWTEELLYLVPSTDKPEGNPHEHLMFIQDDRFLLNQRVRSIMNGTAWAESPRSTLRRIISNVQAHKTADGAVKATSNFVVYRSQGSSLQVFPGHSEYLLESSEDTGFLIRKKRVVLDLEELRPHGRVAFIL
jgi:p-cumate 2,3-dioxygenase beta subunit